MKLNFAEIGIVSKVKYCYDGQETIDIAIKINSEALTSGDQQPVQPISLMFLDFQMPMKTGLQVITEMRAFYGKHADRLIEPKYVIMTAFNTPVF
jgi:CheY-like chemotaxis protein